MSETRFIQALNEAVRIEHTLAMQCEHHALTLRGLWRLSLTPLFREMAEEARAHARKFSEKVVALGATPVAEVGEVKTAHEAEVMVADLLRLERAAMAQYQRCLDLVPGDDLAMKVLLEDHIASEQAHVEGLERLLPRASEGLRQAS